MFINRTEYHQLHRFYFLSIPDEEIIDEFGSVQNFVDLLDDDDEEVLDFLLHRDYELEREEVWTDENGNAEIMYRVETD